MGIKINQQKEPMSSMADAMDALLGDPSAKMALVREQMHRNQFVCGLKTVGGPLNTVSHGFAVGKGKAQNDLRSGGGGANPAGLRRLQAQDGGHPGPPHGQVLAGALRGLEPPHPGDTGHTRIYKVKIWTKFRRKLPREKHFVNFGRTFWRVFAKIQSSFLSKLLNFRLNVRSIFEKN